MLQETRSRSSERPKESERDRENLIGSSEKPKTAILERQVYCRSTRILKNIWQDYTRYLEITRNKSAIHRSD
jgi:hypothetical protein